MCRSMVDIQFMTAENRQGKKQRKKEIKKEEEEEEERKKERNRRTKILWPALFHRAAVTIRLTSADMCSCPYRKADNRSEYFHTAGVVYLVCLTEFK